MRFRPHDLHRIQQRYTALVVISRVGLKQQAVILHRNLREARRAGLAEHAGEQVEVVLHVMMFVVLQQFRVIGILRFHPLAAVRAITLASAGGAEHLKIAHVVNLPRAMADLKEVGVWLTGLDWGDDARPYTKVDFKGRVGLVVGAEGSGISRLVRETCDFIAELPMPGGFESLNAGVAAAVAMYEILRQRNA